MRGVYEKEQKPVNKSMVVKNNRYVRNVFKKINAEELGDY
jgi:hypothetical protein